MARGMVEQIQGVQAALIQQLLYGLSNRAIVFALGAESGQVVEDAQAAKAPIQKLVDKVSQVFVPAMV